MGLFTRARPSAPPNPATWTPEGTTVVQRYRALADATVLVYTAANASRYDGYAAACLGCTYRISRQDRRSLDEAEAADFANHHAGTCRAMPRGIPERAEEEQALQLLHVRLKETRTHDRTRLVRASDLHTLRIDLQRPEAWFTEAMRQLAAAEPNFLTLEPNPDPARSPSFRVQPRPARR